MSSDDQGFVRMYAKLDAMEDRHNERHTEICQRITAVETKAAMIPPRPCAELTTHISDGKNSRLMTWVALLGAFASAVFAAIASKVFNE